MKSNQTYTARMLAAFAAVVLSLSSQAQTTNFIADDFDPAGIGTNSYSGGAIGNIWTNWFGTAYQSVTWDANVDADGSASSGSMLITAAFDNVGNNQFTVFNGYNGFNPGLNAYQWTNFQCDIRFDTNSPVTVNGSSTNYGHLEFGTETFPGNGQDYFGNIEVAAGDTNWHHISINLNAAADNNLTKMTNILFHIYGPWYTTTPLIGTTKLWVDKIRYYGLTNIPTQFPSPRLAPVQNATPALRLFAGDATQTYMRQNIATVAQTGVSWYNNGGATYSVTITNFPALTFQGYEFHLFLIPTTYLPYADPYGNSFAEYDSSNLLALRIVANTTNVVASVAYKTNTPNSNPTVLLANIGATNALGAWTLTFGANNTSISLTTPAGATTNFSIAAADSATFADPMVAYFGVQPNSVAGEGQAVDVTRIQMPNLILDDHFNQDAGLDASKWNIVASVTNSIWVTGPDSKYWLNWTIPDVDFGLGESTTNVAKPVSPTNYSGGAIFDTRLIATNRWALLSTNHVAKNPKNLFFMLRKNPVPTN